MLGREEEGEYDQKFPMLWYSFGSNNTLDSTGQHSTVWVHYITGCLYSDKLSLSCPYFGKGLNKGSHPVRKSVSVFFFF